MNEKYFACIEYDKENNSYIGFVPTVAGAHTEAESLDELYKKLEEVLSLCLLEMDDNDAKNIPEFIGIHQIKLT